jgi:hypothetical protein
MYIMLIYGIWNMEYEMRGICYAMCIINVYIEYVYI